MDTLLELRSMVHAYRDFSECIVRSFSWIGPGALIVVRIDYSWNVDGTIRAGTDSRLLIDLKFSMVQSFRFHNSLPSNVLADPRLLNWSHSEIAVLEIDAAPPLLGSSPELPTAFRAVFAWESAPWIEIVFSSLEIVEHEEMVP